MNAAAARGVPAALARDVITALRTAGVVVEAHTLFPRGLTEETRHRLYPEAAALSLRLGPTGRTPASVLRRRRVAHVLVGGAAAVPATAVPEELSTDPPAPPGEADADADGADPSGPAVPLAG